MSNVVVVDMADETLAYDIGKIRREIAKISESYFYIGLYFYEIKNSGYFGSYKNIYELAAVEFDLKPTSVKNLINVFLKCKCENTVAMSMVYKGYNYSQLVEILPFDVVFIETNLLPSMTVSEIRAIKRSLKLSDGHMSDQRLELVDGQTSDRQNEKISLMVEFDEFTYAKLHSIYKNLTFDNFSECDMIRNIVTNVLNGGYNVEDLV